MHIDTVAWLGSALVVASLMQRDVLRLHVVNVVASVVFIVYDVALSLHPMTVLNAFLAVVSIGQVVRLRRRAQRSDLPPRIAAAVRPHPLIPDPLAAVRR